MFKKLPFCYYFNYTTIFLPTRFLLIINGNRKFSVEKPGRHHLQQKLSVKP
jgi:hypothetical protein